MSGVKNNPRFSRTPDSALTFVHKLSRYSMPSKIWKHCEQTYFRIIAFKASMAKQHASHELSIEEGCYAFLSGVRTIASSILVMYASQKPLGLPS